MNKKEPSSEWKSDSEFASRAIDCARVFGALFIWYFHVGLISRDVPAAWFGEYGVSLFVTLASASYLLFRPEPVDTPRAYARYLARRIRALFPLFAILNIALFAASYVVPPSTLGRPFTVGEFLLSISGIALYVNNRMLSDLWWFIPFIVQVYLLLPPIELTWRRLGGLWTYVIGAMISVAAIWTLHRANLIGLAREWSPLFRLPEVLLGFVVAYGLRDGWMAVWAPLAGHIACVLFMALVLGNSPSTEYIFRMPLFGLLMTLGLGGASLALATKRMPKLFTSCIRRLGTASYAFFLLHGATLTWWAKHVGESAVAWSLNLVACWGTALLLTAGVNWSTELLKNSNRKRAALAFR